MKLLSLRHQFAALFATAFIRTLLISDVFASDTTLRSGSGSFLFRDVEGNPDRPIRVWYHRPKGFERDGRIVFVIHGQGRNATDYRSVWVPLAEQGEFLLVCPEFSNEHYPSSRHFNQGFVRDDENRPRDKREWAFWSIEEIFDRVIDSNRLTAKDYTLYGHSAGGQFVHRMVLFLPEARFKLAIAANPGWYTMPTLELDFPYGLNGADIGNDQLQRAFDRRLVILLGTEDTLTNQENLLNTDEAKAQGPHRFARGLYFFRTGRTMAQAQNADFLWRLVEVPGAHHSNKAMASAAAKLIE